jgi:hypothetical protein
MGFFGFEAAQEFISGDDGEGNLCMLEQKGSCSLDDQRILFEEFG